MTRAPLSAHRRKQAKQLAHRARVAAGQAAARPTQGLRSMPDYLIIGGQRCGTTSLHNYLIQHPGVLPARFTKGVHWFDVAYDKSSGWYRGHFPLDALRRQAADRLHYRPVTGEGSPYYLFHPEVPRRVLQQIPDCRMIALLRDPVERAWSAYHHEQKRGFEDLSFEAALDAEPRRLAGQAELLAAPDGHSYDHLHHAYVARGRYAEQLGRWFDVFGRDQVLVLFTDDLEQRTVEVVSRVQEFLGLPVIAPDVGRQWNKQHNSTLEPRLADRLREAFAEPDRQLAELLGRELPWARP